jgi:hypothetical protein
MVLYAFQLIGKGELPNLVRTGGYEYRYLVFS